MSYSCIENEYKYKIMKKINENDKKKKHIIYQFQVNIW